MLNTQPLKKIVSRFLSGLSEKKTFLILCSCFAFALASAQPVLEITSTDVSCFGGSNGSIDLTISGGTAPYSIQWSNDAVTEDIANLTAAYYNVTVTDANNETAQLGTNINEPREISIELTASDYVVNLRHYSISLKTDEQPNSTVHPFK